MTYEEACAQHSWRVPERYNIAADVCDKHPRDKLAMIHEDPDGDVRELHWGELQDMSNRFAQDARRAGRAARRSRRDAAAADARDRGGVSRHVEGRRDPAVDVDPLRRRGDQAPAEGLAGRDRRDERGQPRPRRGADEGPRAQGRRPRRGLDRVRAGRHRGRRPGAALLHVRHDGPGEGHPACPSLHPRPQRVRVLPRRPGRRALPRHGRMGLGGGDLAADRAVALRRRAGRAAAQGRLRPAPAARVPRRGTGRRTSSARRRRSAR